MKRWILLLVIGVMACEKKVEIEVPYAGDKIVVNSFIQPDSAIYLRVTRSQPPGASTFPEIPDAAITFTAGNMNIPLQWQVINGKGYFVSTMPAPQHVSYNIKVIAPGLDTVTASDTLPRQPLLSQPFAQAGGNRVKFVLKDMKGWDAYQFRIYKGVMNAANQVVLSERLQYRFDPSYNNNFTDLITENYQEVNFITDERFDGNEISVVMQTRNVNVKGEYIILEVTGLTFDAFKYYKTLELQAINDGNPLVDLNRVHSNINKGYGILAGVNAARLQLEIK
ncbi:DUF4249 family protein [Chitinophaga sp. SYP-B3965]|uniref:DUF4249 family protein n=1 Tax=Chitinophaga sp. SYP-B3965 TaxID=2663120 RepID=UPI0012999CC2|nr:DUF4249 family protein [Chitinophaga sp. SYP-B3965]MRG48898.1 DUF4249 family protein [Chitinophaga sp. SYP-B3965]